MAIARQAVLHLPEVHTYYAGTPIQSQVLAEFGPRHSVVMRHHDGQAGRNSAQGLCADVSVHLPWRK